MLSASNRPPLLAQRTTGGGAATLRGHLERPMVGGSHLERRGPSPQGAGSVYWLDRGATAPTAASGGQQFAFVCPARVPLSQLGQSVHEADVGAFEFGLGKHLGSSGGTGRELCGPAAVSRHRLQSQWLEPVGAPPRLEAQRGGFL